MTRFLVAEPTIVMQFNWKGLTQSGPVLGQWQTNAADFPLAVRDCIKSPAHIEAMFWI